VGTDIVACPAKEDNLDETTMGGIFEAAVPSTTDEGFPAGKAVDVCLNGEERSDCRLGLLVALPGFDDNFPVCPVVKAVETRFAVEVNLGDTPGLFVPLAISELIEFGIWECRCLPVGCDDCSCEFADSKVDALPGKLVGTLN
jgi:hypothetical protein